MAADGMMRASDADRDAVVDVLRDAYTAGRLTLEEFGERSSAAYAGRTWDDLRALTVDLPEQPAVGADLPQDSPLSPLNPDNPRNPGAPESPVEPVNPPPGETRRSSRQAGSVMPFVMAWFLIMIAARSGAAVVAPLVIVALLLVVNAISRRR